MGFIMQMYVGVCRCMHGRTFTIESRNSLIAQVSDLAIDANCSSLLVTFESEVIIYNNDNFSASEKHATKEAREVI